MCASGVDVDNTVGGDWELDTSCLVRFIHLLWCPLEHGVLLFAQDKPLQRTLPPAVDITVASPLTSVILGESCQVVGAAASVAENRKMQTYSSKCQELGWACTPLAVETYGNWGEVAQGKLYPTLPLANPQARSQVVCCGGAKHVISGLNHAMA